jgi:choline dehydrogenase-like flavoprotein
MTEHLEHRMNKVEEGTAEAIAIAHDARDDAQMAKTAALGAFRIAQDARVMLRAQQRSLQALRETQVEQGQRLDRLEGNVDRLENKVDRLERKVDDGFTMVSLGMSEIAALIKNVERG